MSIIINEINRATKFFKDNPSKLKNFGTTSPKGELTSELPADDTRVALRRQRAAAQFFGKWMNRLAPIASEIFRNEYGLDNYSLEFWLEYRMEDAYAMSKANKVIFKDVMGNALVDRSWTPEEIELFSENFDEFSRDYQKFLLIKATGKAKHSHTKKATIHGVSRSDYINALLWIKQYTSMSRKTIPKKIWPVLQQISVVPSDLPKKVYRGMFYDGDKIGDVVEWMSRWGKGKYPNEAMKPVSSWSTSKYMAAQFMTPQDFIKDANNGFFMLLEYEITDASVVIADLRKFPENMYWNQQEILLSSEAKNFKVIEIWPYGDSGKVSKYEYELAKTTKGVSISGSSFADIIRSYYFDIASLGFSPAIKTQLRSLSNKTVEEVRETVAFSNHYNDDYEPRMQQVLLPLYLLTLNPNSWIGGGWNLIIKDVVSKSETTISAYFSFMHYGPVSPYKFINSTPGLITTNQMAQDNLGNFKYEESMNIDFSCKLVSTNPNTLSFDLTRISDIVLHLEDNKEMSKPLAYMNDNLKAIFPVVLADFKKSFKNSDIYKKPTTRFTIDI